MLADDRVIAAATAAKEPDAVLKGLKEGAAPDMAAQASAQAATDAAATRTLNLTEQIGAQFPATTQARAATVVSQIGLIPALRSQLSGQTPSAAIQAYSEAIADLFNLNDEITSGSGDPALSDEVRTLGAISRAKDQASQQRAILYAALIESAAGDPAALADAGGLQALTTAAGLEQADLMAFQASATPAEQDAFLSTVASPEVDTAQLLGNFISQAQNLQDVKNLSTQGLGRHYPRHGAGPVVPRHDGHDQPDAHDRAAGGGRDRGAQQDAPAGRARVGDARRRGDRRGAPAGADRDDHRRPVPGRAAAAAAGGRARGRVGPAAFPGRRAQPVRRAGREPRE